MGSKTVNEKPTRDDKSIKTKSNGIKKRPLVKKKYITKLERTLHRSRSLSFISKKTLCYNNRALARCLVQQKRENRDLTNEINNLIAEKFELYQEISRLKSEKYKSKADLEKIANFKKIKNEITGNILEFVRLINSTDNVPTDGNTDSQTTFQTGTGNTEETEQQNDMEQQDQTGLVVNSQHVPKENAQLFNDDATSSKSNDESFRMKSPIDGPKALFDLSAISERSEIESRRSSIQRRSSLVDKRRTKSIGTTIVTRESVIQTRLHSSNRRSSFDLKMATPIYKGVLDEDQPDVLTDIDQREDRSSLHKHRIDEIIELNSDFIKPIQLNKVVGDKETMRNNNANRRATFTVTNSLQIAPWSPVDPVTDSFVSLRKSKPISTSTGSRVEVKRDSSQTNDSLDKPNETLTKLNEQLPNDNEVTNLEVMDMELTEVSFFEVIKNVNGKTRKTKKVVKPSNKKIEKQQSKEINHQSPFLILNDVIKEVDGKRKSNTKAKTSLPRNSIGANGNCYDCDDLDEESIKSLGSYKMWKGRMSSETNELPLATENDSPPSEKPLNKALETIVNTLDPKKSKKRTPKTKNKGEKTINKTEELKKFSKKTDDFINSSLEKADPMDKENEESGRPRRSKKKIDYKCPSLKYKIRRDEIGNTTILKPKVSDTPSRKKRSK